MTITFGERPDPEALDDQGARPRAGAWSAGSDHRRVVGPAGAHGRAVSRSRLASTRSRGGPSRRWTAISRRGRSRSASARRPDAGRSRHDRTRQRRAGGGRVPSSGAIVGRWLLFVGFLEPPGRRVFGLVVSTPSAVWAGRLFPSPGSWRRPAPSSCRRRALRAGVSPRGRGLRRSAAASRARCAPADRRGGRHRRASPTGPTVAGDRGRRGRSGAVRGRAPEPRRRGSRAWSRSPYRRSTSSRSACGWAAWRACSDRRADCRRANGPGGPPVLLARHDRYRDRSRHGAGSGDRRGRVGRRPPHNRLRPSRHRQDGPPRRARRARRDQSLRKRAGGGSNGRRPAQGRFGRAPGRGHGHPPLRVTGQPRPPSRGRRRRPNRRPARASRP